MTDRRPEPTKLIVEYQEQTCTCSEPDWCNRNGVRYRTAQRVADPSDLLAAVRRGVESGTIKGWRIPQFCTHHLLNTQRLSVDYCPKGASLLAEGAPVTCKLIEVLVIPVSDGGSET